MAGHDAEETYLTVAEVAATLKLNQQTVRNWIDAGTLPALRVGRRVRIKRSDFERILQDSYSGTSPERSRDDGPTADGFWGGESVGRAETGEAGEPEARTEPGSRSRGDRDADGADPGSDSDDDRESETGGT